jgi:four helix bundle protein
MVKHNFRQLNIWKDSVELAREVYQLTQNMPSEHKFGISSQMFRAAVSISSNIAEGSAKVSQKEFAYFLSTSLGSAFELETQLVITSQCSIIPANDINHLISRVQVLQKQIASFVNVVKAV